MFFLQLMIEEEWIYWLFLFFLHLVGEQIAVVYRKGGLYTLSNSIRDWNRGRTWDSASTVKTCVSIAIKKILQTWVTSNEFSKSFSRTVAGGGQPASVIQTAGFFSESKGCKLEPEFQSNAAIQWGALHFTTTSSRISVRAASQSWTRYNNSPNFLFLHQTPSPFFFPYKYSSNVILPV